MRFVDPFLGNSIYHIYVYEVSATKNIGQPVSPANFNLIFSKKLVLSDFLLWILRPVPKLMKDLHYKAGRYARVK